jgi:hypothetical protein
VEGNVGLQGTLDTFSLAEVLGLVEVARQTGALEVHGSDSHGTLFTSAGRLVAGEAGDFSGPVESREELDGRLTDVCFLLFRLDGGSFEFVPNRAPAWPAERGTDIGPIVATVERIVREWPMVEMVVPSLEARPHIADELNDDSLTLSRAAFRVFTAVDGERTIRQIARETHRSVVETCFVLKDLAEHGAVVVSEDRPHRTSEPAVTLPPGAIHAVRESMTGPEQTPVEMVTSVPDPGASIDREALERERIALAARAGLPDPGPTPEPEAEVPAEEPAPEDPSRSTITTDRGALLRLFSGLRDQG